MAYDGKVMRRALRQFEEDKQRHARLFAQRRTEIFRREPRLMEIDALLRSTMSQIIAGALQKGKDPKAEIAVIRDNNLALQRERARLLKEAGYPEDALEEQPNCPLCRDTGYRDNKMCRCLQSYYTREQIAELSKMLPMGEETFDTFSFTWYSPDRNGRSRSPRETAERNFDVCRDYAYEFGPRSGNLLLFGQPGLGKTFLSACIARVVSESGHSVVYDTATNIFTQFEASKFRRYDDDDITSDEDVNRYRNCDLLIIDDLGTEMLTNFVKSTFYQIINGRLLAGRKTIISTNLMAEEIGQRYGAPVLSRIEGEYELLPFIGEDIRVQKRTK